MKRKHILFFILLLTVVSFAQQPSSNPKDRTTNPTDQSYTRPVETGHEWGNFGLMGLFGLLGLLGRNRDTTSTGTGYTRTNEEPRRRVG